MPARAGISSAFGAAPRLAAPAEAKLPDFGALGAAMIANPGMVVPHELRDEELERGPAPAAAAPSPLQDEPGARGEARTELLREHARLRGVISRFEKDLREPLPLSVTQRVGMQLNKVMIDRDRLERAAPWLASRWERTRARVGLEPRDPPPAKPKPLPVDPASLSPVQKELYLVRERARLRREIRRDRWTDTSEYMGRVRWALEDRIVENRASVARLESDSPWLKNPLLRLWARARAALLP